MRGIFGLLMGLSFLFSTAAIGADHKHGHKHDHGEHKTLKELKPDKKFESDAPLRSHMKTIRKDLQSRMNEVHSGKFTAKDYQTLASKIDRSIQNIFKDCKLKADADAALHVILSEMMAGSSAMKTGPTSKDRAQGFIKVAKGLEKYGEVFIDPGWTPLKM